MLKKLFGIKEENVIKMHLQKVPTTIESVLEGMKKMEDMYIELGVEEPSIGKWLLKEKEEKLYPESEEFRKAYLNLNLWTTEPSTIRSTPIPEINATLQVAWTLKARKNSILQEYQLFLTPFTENMCI